MPAGDHIPLEKLSGEIREAEGSPFTILWFLCPECDLSHYHMVPFHGGEPLENSELGKVWSRKDIQAGVEGVTLAPSYNSECLHCFVKNGVVEVL